MINFEEIRDIMEAAREEHFTSKGIETCEGIYYMNGLNGTDYDYFEIITYAPLPFLSLKATGSRVIITFNFLRFETINTK